MELQIIRDSKFLTDGNANRFVMALQKEGFQQNIKTTIRTIYKREELFEIDWLLPTIIIEPFQYILPVKEYNNADKDTTAKIVFNILKDNVKDGDTVTLIGRGKTVGVPLSNMIRDNLNVNLIQTNSHTKYFDLKHFINNSEIIICCTNSMICYSLCVDNDMLIDVGNTFNYNKEYSSIDKIYKRKDIGRLTVQQIFKNIKGEI